RITDEIPELVSATGANAGKIGTVANRERRSRLELTDARDFPIAKDLPKQTSIATQEWQFKNVIEDQHVRAIQARGAPVIAVIIGVRQQLGQIGTIVFQFRIGVGHSILQ